MKIYNKQEKKQEEFANKHRIEPPKFKPGDKVWINSSLIIHNEIKKLNLENLVLIKSL